MAVFVGLKVVEVSVGMPTTVLEIMNGEESITVMENRL